MKTQDHYDWIVIGSHPAALLSASLVGRLGLSVLVLPISNLMTFRVSESGQHFDPESNFMVGLGHSEKVEGLVSSCLSKVGILPSEKELIETESIAAQVLTPRVRLALVSTENVQTEFHREFGKNITKQLGLVNALKCVEGEFLSFWNNLPQRLTLSANRKSVIQDPVTLAHLRSRLAKSLEAHDPLLRGWSSTKKRTSSLLSGSGGLDIEEVFSGLWNGVTQGANEDPSLFDLLHMLSLSRTGATFRGGMSAYREFLINVARRHGVHVPIKAECRRIFVEKGRFTGVQVGGRGSMVTCGGGVLGSSLSKMQTRFNYTGRNWFRKGKKSKEPVGWRFSVSLTVRREAIPNGMLARSVWQEKGAPSLEIEIVKSENHGPRAVSDYRLIYLRTLVPYTAESLRLEYQRLVAGRMVRKAIELMPFLEYHMTEIYPDFRVGNGAGTSLGVLGEIRDENAGEVNQLSELYGFASLEAIPDNLISYEGKGLGSSSGIENLFIASQESYPDLGSLGPTVAAIEAVAWLAHRSGLAGPFV